jgi:hypothetical protein
LSFTIGIAVATLVAGSGILVGPTVLQCSRQPQSVGACLRARVVDAGFLPPEPTPPAIVSSQESVSRAPGWIEANATEYETPASGVAALSAQPGQLDAFGALPGPEISAEIALVDPGVTMQADGFAPLARPSGDAALTPTITGSIDATGDGDLSGGLAGDASVEPRVLPPPPQAAGHVGITARGQGRAFLAPQLIADLSPVPSLTEVVAPIVPKMPPPRLVPRPPASPKATAQAKPARIAKPHPPKYDPRYPNVLVLPPPNTGENSSFATLEVR